jgi:uncharacterized membrane protein YraQ (UPF0718 family)
VSATAERTVRDRRVLALLGAGALAWAGAYGVNEVAWTALFTDLLGLDLEDRVPGSVHFFLYDSVKIGLLLVGLMFVVGLVNTQLTPERVRDFLAGRHFFTALLMAVALGAVTPFCSCSSIPIFIGLVAAGVPLSITLTFLVSSPLISETGIVLMGGTFGWDIAALWALAGAVVSLAVGLVLSRFDLDRWVEPFVFTTATARLARQQERPTLADRAAASWSETKATLAKVLPYLVVGVAIGAGIHGWVPEDFFARYAASDNPWALLVATVAGAPLYANPAAVVPLASALYDKGAPLGTVMAFMMSLVALSVPSLVMLRRVMKPQLLAVFTGVTLIGIFLIGAVFNLAT